MDNDGEPEDTKFNILGKRIFTENYKIKEKDGKRRFIVKLNRLPPEYYPSVNGRDYLNSVIVRNKKL